MRRANELVDMHLASAMVTHFGVECERFGTMHLKVGFSRKSGQTKAEFEVDPQTKLTKVTSEILNDLATFLGEGLNFATVFAKPKAVTPKGTKRKSARTA